MCQAKANGGEEPPCRTKLKKQKEEKNKNYKKITTKG